MSGEAKPACNLEAALAEKDAEIERLRVDLDVMTATARSLSHPSKSPFCEHTVNWTFTDDGGKTGRCVLCSEASLKRELEEAKDKLHGITPESKLKGRQMMEKIRAARSEGGKDGESR